MTEPSESKSTEDRARLLTPERDRRRDPRTDPALLDTTEADEAPTGWTEAVTGEAAGRADLQDGGDWTAMVAPDLASDPVDFGDSGGRRRNRGD
ncbi:hypothetical protein [Rhodospira trueperi]|uniref:Uncharacterized protein n=1 Tax=Rhodospira trueperi TaxID=69960 RepID=A0A1G7HD84_9PROT|nr:hypothetical protein [Rhodospira trueperi]SDE98338.1 hypothetical protein SAMN05421720_1204 [Rhodospira trueperi]